MREATPGALREGPDAVTLTAATKGRSLNDPLAHLVLALPAAQLVHGPSEVFGARTKVARLGEVARPFRVRREQDR